MQHYRFCLLQLLDRSVFCLLSFFSNVDYFRKETRKIGGSVLFINSFLKRGWGEGYIINVLTFPMSCTWQCMLGMFVFLILKPFAFLFKCIRNRVQLWTPWLINCQGFLFFHLSWYYKKYSFTISYFTSSLKLMIGSDCWDTSLLLIDRESILYSWNVW